MSSDWRGNRFRNESEWIWLAHNEFQSETVNRVFIILSVLLSRFVFYAIYILCCIQYSFLVHYLYIVYCFQIYLSIVIINCIFVYCIITSLIVYCIFLASRFFHVLININQNQSLRDVLEFLSLYPRFLSLPTLLHLYLSYVSFFSSSISLSSQYFSIPIFSFKYL